MDCGQTYDVVDRPPRDRRFWPAVEDFQERETISKWRDIQQGMCKVIEVQDQGCNKYRPSGVLNFEPPNHFRVVAVFAVICNAKNKDMVV